jgi:hypothetical protein
MDKTGAMYWLAWTAWTACILGATIRWLSLSQPPLSIFYFKFKNKKIEPLR